MVIVYVYSVTALFICQFKLSNNNITETLRGLKHSFFIIEQYMLLSKNVGITNLSNNYSGMKLFSNHKAL